MRTARSAGQDLLDVTRHRGRRDSGPSGDRSLEALGALEDDRQRYGTRRRSGGVGDWVRSSTGVIAALIRPRVIPRRRPAAAPACLDGTNTASANEDTRFGPARYPRTSSYRPRIFRVTDVELSPLRKIVNFLPPAPRRPGRCPGRARPPRSDHERVERIERPDEVLRHEPEGAPCGPPFPRRRFEHHASTPRTTRPADRADRRLKSRRGLVNAEDGAQAVADLAERDAASTRSPAAASGWRAARSALERVERRPTAARSRAARVRATRSASAGPTSRPPGRGCRAAARP